MAEATSTPTPVNYKYYKYNTGGSLGDQYGKFAGPVNFPATELTYDQMVAELKGSAAPTFSMGNVRGSDFAGKTAYDFYAAANPDLLNGNVASDKVMVNGNLTDKSVYDASQKSLASGYTGQDAGYTQGGVKLYKLNDGTVTSTPPAGVASEAPKSTEELRTMGAAKATGGAINNDGTPNINALGIDAAVLAKPGIASLVTSGKEFNAEDAKNFAFAKGETNYQQYIGSVGGKPNPNYIGATSWAALQKQYTPYQLQQATMRTKDGIYWNPAVNIGAIPTIDPATKINSDVKKIADIVSDAKKTADKTTTSESKTGSSSNPEDTTITSDSASNEAEVMSLLKNQYGTSAEAIYNELYNTPEMKAASDDVKTYKAKDDEYNQQLDELKSDIRTEVEGEASESYISALAAVRGDKILKLQRANQRDLDTANATLSSLKDNASMLLQTRVKDQETRYTNLFQMLQLQIQQEGTAFNQEAAVAQIQMNLPEGRSITIGGTTYQGLKENDNLNVIQFTDASRKTYVIGVDKKTGKQVYKQYIGTSPAPQGSAVTPVTELANYNATEELASAKDAKAKIASGDWAVGYDDKGQSFYYDKKAYDTQVEKVNNDWIPFNGTVNKTDFRL